MFLVDTNVLVYASDTEATHHEHCRRLVESWRRQGTPWYLTWGIVYEFLRVVTHPRVFSDPWSLAPAHRFVSAVLAAPSCGLLVPTDRHEDVLATLVADLPALRGNVLHDAHTAALMREHGVRRIITRDGDFRRFDFLDVVDPVEVEPVV